MPTPDGNHPHFKHVFVTLLAAGSVKVQEQMYLYMMLGALELLGARIGASSRASTPAVATGQHGDIASFRPRDGVHAV